MAPDRKNLTVILLLAVGFAFFVIPGIFGGEEVFRQSIIGLLWYISVLLGAMMIYD